MKTTIDLDEAKLERLMKATGIRTHKEAIDYALTEAERVARFKQMMREGLYIREKGDVVYPDYDVQALRDKDRPTR